MPGWKIFGARGAAQGSGGSLGLPRFGHATFQARFPFGDRLAQPTQPCRSRWRSPAGVRSHPATPIARAFPSAALEYRFTNTVATPRSRRSFRSTPATSCRSMAMTSAACAARRADSRSGRPRAKTGRAVARRGAIGDGGRSRRAGESRLVPRRLVRSAHDGVEGCGSGRRVHARPDHRGRAVAGSDALRSVRSGAGRQPRRSRCGWPGTPVTPISAKAPTRPGRRRPSRTRSTTGRGIAGRFCRCRCGRRVLARQLSRPATAQRAVHAVLLRHHASARSDRGGLRESRHPQVADGAATSRRTLLGVRGERRLQRLLRRQLHARLELCAGDSAPLPRPRAHAARNGIRAVAGRARPSAVPHARCRSGRRCTTSTPRPTASSAAS